MTRKLFSFLGTGKYEPCYYYLTNENEKISDSNYCCYVQESFLNLLPKIDKKPDEIVIFITDEAWEKNWVKNNNDKYTFPGLKDTLDKYKGKYNAIPVNIPSGESEQELWQIFDRVLERINPKDEIIFDITHSFRSIPLVAMIILNYAKFVKQCNIGGIYYGAVEALCPPQELAKMPMEDRQCPIFNLTPFVELLDWTVGIDKFISTGDVRQIGLLIEKEQQRFGRLGDKDRSAFFKHFKSSLYSYVSSVATCRGKSISTSSLDLKSKLEEIIDSPELVHIKPIKPLLEEMRSEFKDYSNNEHKNMLKVVKWCCEHNLIQQGITILQEGMITFLCEKYNLDPEDIDLDREIINQAAAIKNSHNKRSKELPIEEWNPIARKNEELVRRLLEDEYFSKAANFLNSMINIRNDINHGGWRKDPSSPKTIEKNLKKFLKEAEELIESGYPD